MPHCLREKKEGRLAMMQVIDNVVIIKLEKGENPTDAIPMLLRRWERVIQQNANLMYEMEKMRERERKQSLMFPG